jgi:hypothetical protein
MVVKQELVALTTRPTTNLTLVQGAVERMLAYRGQLAKAGVAGLEPTTHLS